MILQNPQVRKVHKCGNHAERGQDSLAIPHSCQGSNFVAPRCQVLQVTRQETPSSLGMFLGVDSDREPFNRTGLWQSLHRSPRKTTKNFGQGDLIQFKDCYSKSWFPWLLNLMAPISRCLYELNSNARHQHEGLQHLPDCKPLISRSRQQTPSARRRLY